MNPSGQLIGWHDIAELTQQFGRDRNIVWAKQSNLHGTVGLTYLQGLERSLSTSTKSAMGQTRSFRDVGSMSGLPESGHGWAIVSTS